MTQSDLTTRIDASEALTRLQKAAETGDWAELKPEEAQEVVTLLVEARAQIAAQAEALAGVQELERCAVAYRQAVEPLVGLRKAQGEAYSRMVDDRGVVIGGQREHIAALDALSQQEDVARTALRALKSAALGAQS
ncbi:hypothetical protein [Deinococcus kurensis]|uniref:hypothetical protein n=1 Tax=Deinococcus kurensis TaxID=2662757 RepID=UPI0012D2FD63|nr:hypothetical protein [Deinococcus kurensis]